MKKSNQNSSSDQLAGHGLLVDRFDLRDLGAEAFSIYLSILERINNRIIEDSNKWESWSYPEWKKPITWRIEEMTPHLFSRETWARAMSLTEKLEEMDKL